MRKNQFLIKTFSAVILGVFSFSSISYANEWDDEEFQKLVLEEKIDVYGLNELNESGVLSAGEINNIDYDAFEEDGTAYTISLQVAVNTSGVITSVVSDASSKLHRVIINKSNSAKSTQFPLASK